MRNCRKLFTAFHFFHPIFFNYCSRSWSEELPELKTLSFHLSYVKIKKKKIICRIDKSYSENEKVSHQIKEKF